MDIVSKITRSQMMAGIKNKNTKPEMLIRRALHSKGYRFRLHVNELPGKPDILMPKYKVVIFVHGCFWHGHDCSLFKMPLTRTSFWEEKINKNKLNDAQACTKLTEMGLHVVTIWECALKGKGKQDFDKLIDAVASWIINPDGSDLTLRGS